MVQTPITTDDDNDADNNTDNNNKWWIVESTTFGKSLHRPPELFNLIPLL